MRDQEAELAAAAEAGQDGAYRVYAAFLGKSGRMDQALPWWARAAEHGDADAARTLAICHKDRWEFAEAERWYRSAADRDGGCAFGLATLLKESGDQDGAQEWYARGAALGHVQSLTNGAVLKAARHGAFAEAQAQLDEAAGLGDRKAAAARQVIENIVDDLELWEERLARAEADGDAEAAFEALSPLRDPEYAGMFDMAAAPPVTGWGCRHAALGLPAHPPQPAGLADSRRGRGALRAGPGPSRPRQPPAGLSVRLRRASVADHRNCPRRGPQARPARGRTSAPGSPVYEALHLP
ncbi:hypothetical protein [Streptomyces sp. NPDC090112]|uniref:hypothetical protein n=1 Tax=Streptomyces sp. NPDC090112 TaxID=3365949 RepID=UPI00383037A9